MHINRWTILGVLSLARIAFGFQFQSIASVSPSLVDDLGIGYGQLGTLIGLYMLPGVLMAIPSGILSKRFGDKRMAGYGLLLMVIGGIVLGLSESYSVAFIGRLVSGIGAVSFNVVLTKMVTEWFIDREIRTALGVMLSMWPFGIALALVTQSALSSAYSWEWVIFLTSAVCLVSLALVVSIYRPPEASKNIIYENPRSFAIPFREFVPVSVAGITWALFNVGLVIFFSFGSGLLIDQGLSDIKASSLISIGLWVTLASIPLGGYISQKTGRPKAIIILSSALAALSLALLPFFPYPLILSILLGLGIASAGAIVALPSQALSSENRGPGLGVFYTWYYIGMAIGPVLAGLGREFTDSSATPVLAGSGMFLAVIPFIVMFYLLQAKLEATRHQRVKGQ